jgi:hypothetical protein
MPSKPVNFQLPEAAYGRMQAVRATTGLPHAVNLAWGLKRWLESGCDVGSIKFSVDSTGRQQKLIKLSAEAQLDLSKAREKTYLPLWRIADAAFYTCTMFPPPGAFSAAREPSLAAYSDEQLKVELAARGYRIDRD